MDSYVVGFRIFDGRSLQTEDGNPCDPFVVVECLDERYQSATMENRDAFVPWNETCIWPSIEMYPKMFDQALIEFSVYARHWLMRNFLIGKASLQLSFINHRRHHLYARKWLHLYREDTTSITGMLQVSVFALKPGEQAPSQSQQEQEQPDDENEDSTPRTEEIGDLGKAVLRAKVDVTAGKAHYVQINVHRVEELRELAFPAGVPSPYVTVQFAGCALQTQVGDKCKEHAFNECLQIPVRTPLNEDLILIKLWSQNWLQSDELLGQGTLSFSELRNKSLAPRWFPLYGWNPEEVPDAHVLSELGGELEPNFFKGKLLLSGVVVPLEEGDELQPAKSMPARQVMEPTTKQMALFADVFMVMGAEGRSCKVELSFGFQSKETKVVTYDADSQSTRMQKAEEAALITTPHAKKTTSHLDLAAAAAAPDEDSEDDGATEEWVNSFSFEEDEGRMEPLVVMAPEDPLSQPYVMVSVHTEGYLQSFKRIGCCRMNLTDFPLYECGNLSKPRFFAMKPMPSMARSRNPPSVLLAIDLHNTDNIEREKRRAIKPMMYVVRSYCFLARNIRYDGMRQDSEPQFYSLRVACAGMSKTTHLGQGPRPLWMDAMDMKVILCADASKAPTTEPITVTLVEGGQLSVLDTDVGKTTCPYTHTRTKDAHGRWRPYKLMPQWIAIFGGEYGNKVVGEVLIAFEILQWKYRHLPDLHAKSMWPQPQEAFSKRDHFCKLKKATLHFSLHGLRDLLPLARIESVGLAGGSTAISKPFVTVEVSNFAQPPTAAAAQDGQKDDVPKEATTADSAGGPTEVQQLLFRMESSADDEEAPQRQKPKMERMKRWTTHVGYYGETAASNFEFLQVGTIKCQIPDNILLECYITIRVWEEPSGWGAKLGYAPALIGESRQSLSDLLPCCWLRGVKVNEPYTDQVVDVIRKRLRDSRNIAQVRDQFVDLADGEAANADIFKGDSAWGVVRRLTTEPGTENAIKRHSQLKSDFIDSSAVPEPIREAAIHHTCRPLSTSDRCMNMQSEPSFSPRKGEALAVLGVDSSRKAVHGKLEDSTTDPFVHDFWYKNVPLLRNQDIVQNDDAEADWNFQPRRCFGFVKCAFKLEDGWEEDEADAAASRKAETGDQREEGDKLRRSFEFSEDLNSYAFDKVALRQKFKGPGLPARVRVRIYLVKAVCVYGKGTGFADPYIDFQLGRHHHVQMRNFAQISTNTPEFYRMEERDIELPEDGRLEVRLMDKVDLALSDTVIGSTIIDLEDRWHSMEWQKHNENRLVPVEHRSLYTQEYPGKNRGNIECWIEMHDTMARDCLPSLLVKPPEAELEIRLVVWTCVNLKLLEKEGSPSYINAKISTKLDCKEYNGHQSSLQETDVHWNSDGKAVFNWRMVYPKVKMPVTVCNLLVCLYHHELTGDTFIGSLNIGLKKFVERVARDLDGLAIGPNDLSFSNNETGEDDDVGTVNMSMYVLSQLEADCKPVGIARDEPNENPQLITPLEGRDWGEVLATWNFQWPDFSMFKKMGPIIAVGAAFLGVILFFKVIGVL